MIKKVVCSLLPIFDYDNNQPNQELADKLVNDNYVYQTGIVNGANTACLLLSRFAVNAKNMSQEQLAKYQRDKQYNYREYVIRVAGFCFAESDDGIYDYFLRKYIYDENGRLIDRCFTNNKEIYQQAINNNRITAISFGFDAGKHDDASVVCCLLTDKNYCIVYDYIKRLQQPTDIKNQIRELVNERLIFFIKHCLKSLGITQDTELKYTRNIIYVYTDNDLIVEILNKKFKEQNLNN